MTPVSRIIADWCCGPAIDELPEAGRALIRRAFLDTLAVALLGSRLDAPRIVARTEMARAPGSVASVFGMGRKLDLLGAALVNGTSAHADLFDDNSAPMIAHPSAPLVCSLMPLAQSRGLGGRALMDAYAVGFEVGVRLGRRLNPSLYEQGWHATRVLGVLGCTAACCRLLGLDAPAAANALGIAVSMASGVRQNFGTMSMALHVGLTARDAVHCALLAEAGMQSDAHAFEGKYGFVQLYSGLKLDDFQLGQPFELIDSGIIFKPYPCGAPTHAAVDAALALRQDLQGDLECIEHVECLVHPWNAMTLREETPRDALQARVNLRYCVAAALVHGELGFMQFTEEALALAPVQALMAKMSVSISHDLPDNGEFPAQVRVRTVQGNLLSQRRDVPPGGSSRPLSLAQVTAKFLSCTQLALDAKVAAQVIELVGQLERLHRLDDLCEALEGRPLA